MSKVTKNSIPSNLIDFNATALASNSPEGIQLTDKVEYYYQTGELAASVSVGNIVHFLELNNLHVPDDKYEHECNALEYFDKCFDVATTQYFNSVLAAGKELDNAA